MRLTLQSRDFKEAWLCMHVWERVRLWLNECLSESVCLWVSVWELVCVCVYVCVRECVCERELGCVCGCNVSEYAWINAFIPNLVIRCWISSNALTQYYFLSPWRILECWDEMDWKENTELPFCSFSFLRISHHKVAGSIPATQVIMLQVNKLICYIQYRSAHI